VDIGSRECRAVCVAHGRPLLASFVASPIGLVHASSRFRRTLQSSVLSSTTAAGAAGDESRIEEKTVECRSELDLAFTNALFEKTAVAAAGSSGGQVADVVCVRRDHRLSPSAGEAAGEETVTVPGWLRQDCLMSLIEGGRSDEGGCSKHNTMTMKCVKYNVVQFVLLYVVSLSVHTDTHLLL
jgi:hypothetical protein